MMTDASKNVVWKALYEPFGAVSSITGAAANAMRFPGQWFQLEAGLHYNWWRHYDPTLGRYTQADPLSVNRLGVGPSLYAYAGNSPLMKTDPDGRFVPLVALVGRVAVGAAIGAGFDVALQLALNGGRIDCVNWWEVGGAAAVGAALPPGLQALRRVIAPAAEGGEVALQGASSLYDTSITRVGSRYLNVQTDVGSQQFQLNLLSNGYNVAKQTPTTTVLRKGANEFSFYTRTSTEFYGAMFNPNNNGKIIKYSLGGP